MKKFLLLLTGFAILCTASCGKAETASTGSPSAAETPSSEESSQTASRENDYSQQTYSVPESLDKIKIDGRYMTVAKDITYNTEAGISFDSTGSGIEWNADCEGDVLLNLTVTTPNDASGEALNCYYTVYVDGELKERMYVTGVIGISKAVSLTVATGLERGSHSFAVYRQGEANKGVQSVNSITLNGQLTERPADKSLYIEFVGDSITAGFGNLTANGTENANSPVYQDGMQTYATITAKNMDADFSVMAISGLGISVGLGNNSCQYYYERTSWKRSGEMYGFERQPDIVVINLHTNDWDKGGSKGSLSADKFKQDSASFFSFVRQKNPNAKIVWAYGMMNTGFSNEINQVINELGGTEKGFYSVQLSDGGAERGGAWHTSTAGHKNAAAQLTEFLKGIQG